MKIEQKNIFKLYEKVPDFYIYLFEKKQSKKNTRI